MDATAVATVGAVVMTATQIIKKALPGDWDRFAVFICGVLSLIGVLVWIFSAPVFPPARTDAFSVLAGWISVYAIAVGLYETAKMVTKS